MLQFWRLVFVEANRITFDWLFGNWRRRIIDAAIFLGAVIFLKYSGKDSVMFDELTWMQASLAAIVCLYVPLFFINMLRVPSIWKEENLEKITQLEAALGQVSEGPSFKLTLETLALDVGAVENYLNCDRDENSLFSFENQVLARISVENADTKYIDGCRVVVEEITPPTNIPAGAELYPDVRQNQEEESTEFGLARTQKMHLKVLEMHREIFEDDCPLTLNVVCDWAPNLGQIRKLFQKGRSNLKFGTVYHVTLAVHGIDARSCRMHLKIDAKSETEISISEVKKFE